MTLGSAVIPRFLALGDSYTIGEGVADADRWPVQLANALRRNQSVDEPDILARTGWTTVELADAMQSHAFLPPYALVTLLIGVNDQYRGRDIAGYRADFQRLLERAIALAGGQPERVVVVSIPDWGVTRFGRESGRELSRISAEIDLYNATNAHISHLLHAGYADVTSLSRSAGDHADMLVDDGLHPSASAYRQWADAILPAAERALRASGR